MDTIRNLIAWFIEFVLHMDKQLPIIVDSIGFWTYLALFMVVFIETGVVIMPFLPGDSLIFAAGAISALPLPSGKPSLNPLLLYAIFAGAAILGDTANYWIGHYLGDRVFTGNIRWLKKEYLYRTQAFYEKHGGKTIFLARFVPIIRTFAPFVAGVGRMRYGYFISYNIIGGLTWTGLFMLAGFFFGNLPVVRNNFSLVVIAIILISLIPVIVEFIKARTSTPTSASPE